MTTQTLITHLLAVAFAGSLSLAAQAGTSAPAAPAQPAAANADASDDAITNEVKAALAQNQKVAALQIGVSTQAGVVVLKGSVPDTDSAEQAVRVAAAVPGVRQIHNELKVQS